MSTKESSEIGKLWVELNELFEFFYFSSDKKTVWIKTKFHKELTDKINELEIKLKEKGLL